MNSIQVIAESRHFTYMVDGTLVIVRAVDEQQAKAALCRVYGFGAQIEGPSHSVLAGDHAE